MDILGVQQNQQQQQQQLQRTQQQQAARTNSMFNVNAVPNSVGQPSYNTGFGNNANTANTRPYCRQTEKRQLFDNCAMTFGMAHMNQFSYLQANRPYCRVNVFQCSHVDTLVRCLNSQPQSAISNACWLDKENALTEFLHNYQIPCQFQDIKAKCQNSSVNFLTVEQRPRAGVGINNNPLTFLAPIIRRIAMPLLMMYQMGGLAF
ncbi:hypothetical protein V1264_011017 [Littorina saxatilis]|uniref:Uncharacterized protein n=2 Tax=Littorina saxatilis TaxID=31220 RepID=A0AAN9GKK1_9CAEN